MSADLKGSEYGANRAAIVALAKEKAVQYFSTECVVVKIENERPHPVMSGFIADFTATIWHEVERPAYGFPFCRKCKKREDSREKLNSKSKVWE